MSSKKKPIPKRAEENTTLTISLQRELKERIEAAAATDRRKVSPWVAIQLEKALDEIIPESQGSVRYDSRPMGALKIAETPLSEGNGTEL
jgi:hypothetical protein